MTCISMNFSSNLTRCVGLYLVLFFLLITNMMAENIELIRDGKAHGVIYVSDINSEGSITDALDLAVEELNGHLQRMSGVELEVQRVKDSSQVQGPGIVLGAVAVQMGAKPEKTSMSHEGFRLLTKDGLVLIGGESDDGVLFGVYTLLREFGCDWVFPGEIGIVAPEQKTLTVVKIDRSEAPGAAIRTQWYGGGRKAVSEEEEADFIQWQRRQGRGEYEHPALKARGHYWNTVIRKHKEEFDANPSMYALVKLPSGALVRKGPQVESTHPRVIELIAQDIRDLFEKNKWPHDKAVGFPIGPADGSSFSYSEESRKANVDRIDPMSGREDVSDLMVLIANKVLEALGDEYPNVYLGYYIYAQYSQYPVRYKPHPRIVPVFASINYSRVYSSVDPRSKMRATHRKAVEQWAKLAKEQGNYMISRDFNYNLADGMSPITKLRFWGEEIPFYHKAGVFAYIVNSSKDWANSAAQSYVLQRLMWNPELDWKQLLSEYCEKAYGAAAAPMEAYYLGLVETQGNARQEAGSFHVLPLIFDETFVEESRKRLEEALKAAGTDADRERVGFVREGFRSLELYLEYFQAAIAFDFTKAKRLIGEMKAHQERMIKRNSQLASRGGGRYIERFLEDFAENAERYSSGDYQIVERLPDALPTLFDPNQIGEDMEYFHPAIEGETWIRTKTFSSTWDAQGLGNLRGGKRGGAVWYKHQFLLETKPASLALFLGGFDDEARVWMNGKFIGSSGRQFSKSAVFDVSDTIQEGNNSVTIEVVRNSWLNELGTGGLLRPSFFFTGPQLEKPANVLPEEIAEELRKQQLEMSEEGEQAY